MIKHMHRLILLAFLTLVTACKEDTLSFDSVESARVQANENSEYNAKAFRVAHPEYTAFSISMRGDSTQSAKCGQGDGWATIDLVNIDKGVKVVLKCSTVSAATSCMTEEDFKTRAYAANEGKCDDSIPFPLPKIQK
jgi:hypothetical protein